jgi:hypothetical protein
MVAMGAPPLKSLRDPPIPGLDTIAAYCRAQFNTALSSDDSVRRLIAQLALVPGVGQDLARALTIAEAAEALLRAGHRRPEVAAQGQAEDRLPAAGDQGGAGQAQGAGAAGASDQGRAGQAEGNAAGRAGDQGRAEPAEEVGGTKADGDRDELIQGMKRSVRLAYLAFAYAESRAGKRLEDLEAYALLQEGGIPGDAGDRGELTDYSLPSFVTWGRQLRDAREALGEQKYTRRSGRPLGKGIVKADRVENLQDRNQ